MARAPSTVSLLDVFEAVAEPNVELFSIDNPFSDWKDRCYVHDVLSGLRNEMDRDFRNRLASIKVSSLYSADRALEKEGLADEAALKAIDADVKKIVAEAAEFARTSPEPEPAELYTEVYVEAAQ